MIRIESTLAVMALSALLTTSCARAGLQAAPLAPEGRRDVILSTRLAQLDDGRAVTLQEVAGGRPMLVNLWATWCDACKNELPALGRLATRAKSRGAVLAMVAVGEPRATALAYAAREHMQGALLVDEDFHFADAVGTRVLPSTFVFDREGRLVYQGGRLDKAALDALDHASANAPPRDLAYTR